MDTWQTAQKEELACWTSNRQKIQHPEYLEYKKVYWRKILEKSGIASYEQLRQNNVLEVGCGPTGISLLFPRNDQYPNFSILDPLLTEYKQLYPDYFGICNEISTSLEQYGKAASHTTYDLIFAINCIDHCDDIDVFLQSLHALSGSGTMLYVAVNTHQRAITARIWRALQWLLEPHHPYHFTEQEYRGLFGSLFTLDRVIDIEDEILWINNMTRDIAVEQKKMTFLSKVKKMVGRLRPSRMIFGLLEWFGLPAHDFKHRGDSIYRHKMFVLTPK